MNMTQYFTNRCYGTYKKVSIPMALVIFAQLAFPTISFALTSGPTQPEVQGFTPISTSEMVDVFTGDFNYNIPLMDIDGYPINISYKSGVTMEEEASWVGLGWSLNVGVVNRSMRGIPDDFKGDQISKKQNMKPTRTVGISGGISGIEFFGFDFLTAFGISATASAGVNFNNYTGFGFEKTVSLSINSSKTGSGPLTGSLGITSDTNEGISIQPSLSLAARGEKTTKENTVPGMTIGSSYNSRYGLKQLSITTTIEKKNSSYRSWSRSKTFDLGSPTYTPSGGMDMKNLSVSGRFTIGQSLFGSHPNAFINAYYSCQELDGTSSTNHAYGYLYAGYGEGDNEALMDFNREKDVPFVNSIPVLPITNMTNDLFSVSGQGVGGSYKLFRGDVGNVFDPATTSSSEGYSLGGELGFGAVSHIGGSINVNTVNSTTGRWGNPSAMSFTKPEEGSLHEPAYFKEASERTVSTDPEWLASLGGYAPARPGVSGGNYSKSIDNSFVSTNGSTSLSSSKRNSRDARNQLLSTLTYEEVLSGYGLFGDQHYMLGISGSLQMHHIAQITSLANDGSRYVYAHPLLNESQIEVTFAVGHPSSHAQSLRPGCSSSYTNYTTYADIDASTENNRGLDNYFEETHTPAYAHSYLLTALLSKDYIDKDGDGPSPTDLGSYTLFSYSAPYTYLWRAPYEDHSANFNEGVRIDPSDDKASFVSGVKEQRYLERIETKNYVAVFRTGESLGISRLDAKGVKDQNGGYDISSSASSQHLVRIDLYTTAAYKHAEDYGYTPVPIKSVHFEYDYSLCQNIPNTSGESPDNGKLTLKRIYFTFQGSGKGALSPYEFEYGFNPDYNRLNVDRWGYYQPSSDPSINDELITNADYPYVDQSLSYYDASNYASAWHLTSIILPSGAEISVRYESDDYAYVQDKRAMQMCKIIGTYVSDSDFDIPTGDCEAMEIDPNEYLVFELPSQDNYSISQFMMGINTTVYLRCMVNLKPGDIQMPTCDDPGSFESIPVYANKTNADIRHLDTNGDSTPDKYVGIIKLSPVEFSNFSGDRSPISLAAIQYGRLHAPRIVYDENGELPDLTNAEGLTINLLEELGSFVLGHNLSEIFHTANGHLYEVGLGHKILTGKSFIRVSNPEHNKRGGGSRVRSVLINDHWHELSDSNAENQVYGQLYQYTLPSGASSGVASYEPMIGADENPFRMPVEYELNNILAPDEARFIEKPIGESFYPSPSVGYSMVTITDYVPGATTASMSDDAHVNHHGTGKIIQEFYTARDFPTIVDYTSINLSRAKTNPFSISSLLNINSKDYVTASQGFAIELNDMHGKQKSQAVYKEGSNDPISSVTYNYQMTQIAGKNRLVNEVSVIHPDGSVSTGDIGVHFDMVADTRKATTETTGGGASGNTDLFSIPPLIPLLPVPSLWPDYSHEMVVFQNATATKLIQRFAVLSSVRAMDNTSVVETKNLAYDAVTGDVLVTETVNNYDDPVYSLTFPAHWYYEGMGPAYLNINYSSPSLEFIDGVAQVSNAPIYFVPGDEVITSGDKAWILEVDENSIVAVRDNGSALVGSHTLKVIRSGRRNMSNAPIAQYTLLANPLDYFGSNVYEKVLQASAIEFTDEWTTFCDCFSEDNINLTTINPYQLGTKGIWRPTRNYTYLTERNQSYYNYNTNVRRDGTFMSFSPFYFVDDGDWQMNKANWTWASEVTAFSPFGQEVENMDALGRYSSALFGYHQTLPIAVAANAAYSDIRFSHFEDVGVKGDCGRSFDFEGGYIDSTRAHTGRTSLRIPAGESAQYGLILWDQCSPSDSTFSLVASTDSTVNILYGSGYYDVDIVEYLGTAEVISVTSGVINLSTSTYYSIKLVVTDSYGGNAEIYLHNP